MFNGEDEVRIGMLPCYSGDEWEEKANPHLKLLAEAMTRAGCEVVRLTPPDMRDLRSLKAKGVELIFLHWPSSILELDTYSKGFLANATAFLEGRSKAANGNNLFVTAYSRLCRALAEVCRRVYAYRVGIAALQQVGRTMDVIDASGLPLVWEQHDLSSHHFLAQPFLESVDLKLHRELYTRAAAIVVHELSCLTPVFDLYGQKKRYAVAKLGPFPYGAMREKSEARRSLHLECEGKIITYIGTVRGNRNPASTIRAFLNVARKGDLLVVAGMGVKQYHDVSDGRIVVFDGLLPGEIIRDIFCASDFIVNDGERYLTSAVVRTAMAYGVPVIIRPFGSSLDMARNASIFIKDNGLEQALKEAFSLDHESYEKMKREALLRDAERTWQTSGDNLVRLFGNLISGEV